MTDPARFTSPRSIIDSRDGLQPIFRRPDWYARAACKGKTDLFFPAEGGNRSKHYDEARAICAACPVLDECQEWAVATYAVGLGGDHGFAGGMSPRERKRARRREALRAA